MSSPRLDDQFSNALRAELVSRVQKASPSRRQVHRKVWVGAGVVAGTVLLGGIGAAAAGWFPTRGGLQETPLASPAEGTYTSAAPAQAAKPGNAYASIPENEIEHISTDADYIWDGTDPYYGYNKVPVVARVQIDSIDGGRAFSPISNQYVYPQTVGKMTVREVYKGDIKPGEQLKYSRLGGTVTFDEYWNSLNQPQKEKILSENKGQKPADKKYVQKKFTEDVDIEAGKEYVVFLLPQSSKDGKVREYFIDGFEYGLREVKGSGPETTVLDNQANAWVSLGSVVRLQPQ